MHVTYAKKIYIYIIFLGRDELKAKVENQQKEIIDLQQKVWIFS